MANWWSGGQPGPRGGREIRAAYTMLSDDLVALHGELGRSRLDTVRLSAMIEAMAEQTAALWAELRTAREQVAALRARTVTDPLVELLARQSSDLRAQLVDNQRTITDLTTRLTDLLEAHLELAAQARDAASARERAAATPSRPTPARDYESARAYEPAARTGTGADEVIGSVPVADLRRPETAAAGERLRLIRRALDV